jgi:alpha-tubulin suppressor-like RCC1 family protein
MMTTALFAFCVVLLAAISVPGGVASARASDHVLYGWGNNNTNQLGIPITGTNYSDVPVPAAAVSDTKSISAGGESAIALLKNGTNESWGSNNQGQLGNGGLGLGPLPVANIATIKSASYGADTGIALLKGGTVADWGNNYYGELGNGTTVTTGCVCSEVPVAVPGLKHVKAVAEGFVTSYALLNNGTVMAWGFNRFGNLGNGTTTDSDVPVKVSGLSGVVAIFAGYFRAYALLSDGVVMGWGQQPLGDGSGMGSNVPVAVPDLSGVKAMAVGGGFSLALLGNGTLMGWGDNTYGQLGVSPTVLAESSTPVVVPNLGGIKAISAGDGFALALLGNGSVESWGNDASGELGLGEEGDGSPHLPAIVQGLNHVKSIATGEDFSLAGT